MSDTGRIRGGKLLARAFKQKGVDHVFTLSGGFCNPALEGFMECQIPVLNCPHEQVAGHLADGHARITRKPVVCLVGPEGFANAVPAMLEAWGERSPVIFVTGSSTRKRQGSGGFKEIDDVAAAVPFTKHSSAVTDGERIGEFVDRAWKVASSGYPGPVHLSVPVDIMFSSYEIDCDRLERPFDRSPRTPHRAWPDPGRVARSAGSDRFGATSGFDLRSRVWWSKSEKSLLDAAKALRIPIFVVPYHQKLIGSECESHMGLADFHQYQPSKFAIQSSDVAVLIGGRLDNQMNFGNPPFFPETTRLICVNGSHEELEYNRAADQSLLCHPGAFFDSMARHRSAATWSMDRNWLETNIGKRKEWVETTLSDLAGETGSDDAAPGKMHPLQMSLDVQESMSDGDWLVFDGGNTHFWAEIAHNIASWRGKTPRWRLASRQLQPARGRSLVRLVGKSVKS